MAKRRRKAKKNRKTIANLKELLKNIKVRVPIPPVGCRFKSIKDFNRQHNKKMTKKEVEDSE